MLSTLAALSAVAFAAAAPAPQRQEAVALALVMDGKLVGWAKPIPNPSKDMVLKGKKILQNFTSAPNGGQIPMEEMTLMAPEWYAWTHTCMIGDFSRGIKEAKSKRLYDKQDVHKDITINVYDRAGRLTSVCTLKNAFVTAVKLPALDASSKGPAAFQFNLATDEMVLEGKPSDQRPRTPPKTQPWTASNFKFELGNLPCKKVMKVDAITIKQTTVSAEAPRIGDLRPADKVGAPVSMTTLRVTIDKADAKKWADWVDETTRGGTKPKQGSITLLSPDTGGQAMRIEMKNVMVSSYSVGSSSSTDKGRTVTITLQVDEMDYEFVRRQALSVLDVEADALR